MVNVAEEVKNPRRNLPIAILASLGLTSLLYFCVTMTVVLAVDQQELAVSNSPLSLVFAKGGRAASLITGIGMLSGLNGALVQIVMASRVAYGLAQKREAPSFIREGQLQDSHAVDCNGCDYRLRAWTGALAAYCLTGQSDKHHPAHRLCDLVNLSLIVVRVRDQRPTVGPSYPLWLPVTGLLASLAFLVFHAAAMIVGNQ